MNKKIIFLFLIFGIVLLSGSVLAGTCYVFDTLDYRVVDSIPCTSDYDINPFLQLSEFITNCRCVDDGSGRLTPELEEVCSHDRVSPGYYTGGSPVDEIQVLGNTSYPSACEDCKGKKVSYYTLGVNTANPKIWWELQVCRTPEEYLCEEGEDCVHGDEGASCYYSCEGENQFDRYKKNCYQCEYKEFEGEWYHIISKTKHMTGFTESYQRHITTYSKACSEILGCPINPECPGNANGDNIVNSKDYAIVAAKIGKPCGDDLSNCFDCCNGADMNDDRRIDILDLNIVMANWLETCTGDYYCPITIEIDKCQQLTERDAKYVLTEDIVVEDYMDLSKDEENGWRSCLQILAGGITLNCQKKSITIPSGGIVFSDDEPQISPSGIGIGVGNAIYSGGACSRIENCVVNSSDVGDNPASQAGILVESPDFAQIINNEVSHIGVGIFLRSIGEYADVVNNNVYETYSSGISIWTSLNRLLVEGNDVSDNMGVGIYVYNCTNCLVENNKVSDVKFGGISVDTGINGLIINNEVSDITYKPHIIWQEQTGGIIFSGRKGYIAENKISHVKGYGIHLRNANRTLVQSNIIENVFKNPKPRDPSSPKPEEYYGTGIYAYPNIGYRGTKIVHGGVNEMLYIENNEISGAEGAGIRIANGAEQNIRENIVSSSKAGFVSSKSEDLIIEDNDFCAGTDADVSCERDHTFSSNTCDSGDVCGGICTPCTASISSLSLWGMIKQFFEKLF